MNPDPRLKHYLDGLLELQGAIDRKAVNPGLWTAAEGIMTLFDHIQPRNNLDSLTSVLSVEIKFAQWLRAMNPASLNQVTRAAEVFAAHLQADSIDYYCKLQPLEETVIASIGDERIKQGSVFVEWVEQLFADFNVENGHIHLAKQLGTCSVFHASQTLDTGIRDYVYFKLARHWEWMVNHPGGFLIAGYELCAIGYEKIGTILRRNSFSPLGSSRVAWALALQGGDEMGVEVRDVIEFEPLGGGCVDETLEYCMDTDLHTRIALLIAAEERVVLITGSVLNIVDLVTGRQLKEIETGNIVSSATLLRDGEVLVCDSNGDILLIDLTTGEQVQDLLSSQQREPASFGLVALDSESFLFSRDGRNLSSRRLVTNDGGEMSLAPSSMRWPEQQSRTLAVVVFGDDKIATTRLDGMVSIFNKFEGNLISQVQMDRRWTHLDVLANGWLVGIDHQSRLWTWDGSKAPSVWSSFVDNGQLGRVNSMLVLGNGSVVTGHRYGFIIHSTEPETRGSMECVFIDPVHRLNEVHVLDDEPDEDGIVVLAAIGKGQRFLAVPGGGGPPCVRDGSRIGTRDVPPSSTDSEITVLFDGRIVCESRSGRGLEIFKKPQRGECPVVDRRLEFGNQIGAISWPVPLLDNGVAWGRWMKSEYFIWMAGEGLKVTGTIKGSVWGLATTSDGRELVVLDEAGVHLRDVRVGGLIRSIAVEWGECLELLDDDRAVVGGWAGDFAVFHLRTGEMSHKMTVGDLEGLKRVSVVSPELVLALNLEDEVWIVNLSQGTNEQSPEGFPLDYVSIGRGLILAKDRDGLRVAAVPSGKTRTTLGGIMGADVKSMTWSKEFQMAVLLMRNGFWVAYDLSSV